MEPLNPWPDSSEQHGRMFKENNLFVDQLASIGPGLKSSTVVLTDNHELLNLLNEWNL